jgi:hypothetical protein
VVREVGVERDGVAGRERMALVVDEQRQRPGLDDRGLAGAGLVHRRVARAACRGARREPVARELGAQAGQRRAEDLVAVAVCAAAAALAGAHDRHRAALVEPQQLGQPQLEAGGDPRGDLQRRAGLSALHLREHRRRDAGTQREVAQREVHRLPQRLHPRPDGGKGFDRRCHTNVRYHVQRSTG